MKPTDFVKGDRVSFTERVHPKVSCGFRYHAESGKPIATPEIPKQIVQQRGEGIVTREAKEEKVNGRKVWTLKVHAGSGLGEIVIVADDAVLTAHPLTLDVGDLPAPNHRGPSMYGSDAKGIA